MFSPIQISRAATLIRGFNTTPLKRTAVNLFKEIARPPLPKYGVPMAYVRRTKRARLSKRKVTALAGAMYASRKRYKRRYTKKTTFRRRQIGYIGETVGTDRCRSATVFSDKNNYNTGGLYSFNLIKVEEGTGNHQRLRDLINVRGIKLYLEFQAAAADRKMYISMAAVVNKQSDEIIGDDFFRSNSEVRALPFNSAEFSGMDRHTRAINTDQYAVLWHKKFMLNTSGNAFVQNPNLSAQKTLTKYIKVNRQFRFEQADNTDKAINPIYLVFWIDRFDTPKEVTTPITNAITLQMRQVIYFRNTKD